MCGVAGSAPGERTQGSQGVVGDAPGPDEIPQRGDELLVGEEPRVVDSADAETKAVKMPTAVNIVPSRETCDVSILGFPGYVLTNR